MQTSLVPQSAELAIYENMSKVMAASNLAPEGAKEAMQAYTLMLRGRELGLPPMASVELIRVVKGRTVLSAELMLSLVLRSGGSVEYKELSDTRCIIEACRAGGKPCTFTFTIEDARRADLLKKEVWQKYPRAMLRSRCISEMGRSLFADVLLGASYTMEELEDVPEDRPAAVPSLPLPAPEQKQLAAPDKKEANVLVPFVPPVAKILQAFSVHGVTKEDLEDYLKCSLENMVEIDVAALRKIKDAIVKTPESVSFFFKRKDPNEQL